MYVSNIFIELYYKLVVDEIVIDLNSQPDFRTTIYACKISLQFISIFRISFIKATSQQCSS
jgi:hypothetical protein